MRTLVDIPEQELGLLTKLGQQKGVSRAHLVRTAITQYLESQKQDTLDLAFGMWADRKIDGLEYQEKMRREWDHRP